ncbi:MAG: hypothetical protein LBG77_08625 [Dysgonamonadaceae bacterium]|nr:hypothetical protein [Dysgonamonadaceae bacterium]
MKIRLIILLILTGAPNWISAQIGMFYTTDNELLSSSLINSIYQDSRNYIWIATEDGINKYDGVKFVTYKNRPDDSSTIQNNYVHSLLEDSFGRFWIGCINALHRYDRMSNQFTKIPVYDGKVLIYPHITNIIESKNHEVWMTTSGHGVIRIKPEDTTVSTDYELSKRLSSMHLTAVFEDSKGRFWIASEYNGLNLYNPVTNEVQVFKQPQIGSNQISSICEDKQGNIFVGTLTKGLFRLNIHTQQFELIPHTGRQILSVKCLMIDNNGRLLVGTDGQGIKIFNEEKQYLDDKAMLSAPFDLSKMKVHALLQDKSGNIWMGLFQKGVFLDPANSNQFNYLGHRSFHRNVIGMSCVMSLLKDKSDNLWVGTDNDGVYKIDRQNRSQHFAPAGNRNSAPNTVFAMIEDEKSNIWMGSYLQGLSCLNPQNGQIVYYNNYFDVIDDNTARNKIFCMTKDQQNRLWIGTNGAGIYVFDLQTKKYIAHYSQRLKNDKIIPNDWINCIRCNDDGTILAGSYGGFFSIHPKTNRLENHIKNGVLPGNVVYCINEDENGNLWIGTTEGLACFDRKKGVSSIYTTENGLPSNVICALVNDGSGNLWISTHQGISKMKIASREFVNYFVFDGLQGNEFSMGSAFKSKDGELFFGGTSGVTSFYPAQINDQKAPLNIYLTGLYLGDKQVVPFQKSGKREIFKGYISDADTICFSYDDNIFGLEFSTFDFGFSERVSYQYILEGLNSQWISTEPGVNRINFTNLNYGTYRLKIKASIYANSSNEKDITLIILPPWYLSGWAKSAYLLLFILLIYGVTIFIRNQMRQRSELLRREYAEQISEAKLQFFINISHEIRTPMTLIINPIERLVTENKDPKLQEMYLLIYRNAQRILQLINQLMDVRKIDKGQMSLRYCETDIVGFTDDLMQTFKYQAT